MPPVWEPEFIHQFKIERSCNMAKDKPRLKAGAGEAGSVKALKKSLKRNSAGGYLARITGNGRTVRFLTEPDKFFKFFEHYDESLENDRYFPCTEDCRGCDEGLSSSKRFLANALDTEDNKVIPIVLPTSLVSNLMKKYDKFGTLMDRDYELTKDGTGMDTEYDALYESPKKMKTSRFDLLDLEDVLVNIAMGVTDADDDDDEDDDDDAPKKTKPGGKPGGGKGKPVKKTKSAPEPKKKPIKKLGKKK